MPSEDYLAYLDGPFAGLAPLVKPTTPFNRFHEWLTAAKGGSSFVYATGITWLSGKSVDAETKAVADAAWKAIRSQRRRTADLQEAGIMRRPKSRARKLVTEGKLAVLGELFRAALRRDVLRIGKRMTNQERDELAAWHRCAKRWQKEHDDAEAERRIAQRLAGG